MPFKFNPFTGTLDVVNAPPDQYIDGEVEFHGDLPVTVGTPPIDSAYLVRKGSGLYFLSRKPAGVWVRELNNGNLDDWKYAGTFSDLYRDSNFRVINDADASKEIAFSAASISSGQTRTLTVPDRNVIVAPSEFRVLSATATAVIGDRIAADTTAGAFTIALPASPASGDTIEIADHAATFGSNALTLGRNGNLIESLAEDLVANVNRALFTLVWVGGSVGWRIVAQSATANNDASLLTTGTLADARLSTNVPLKDAANTFTQNQTLNGTNNVMPNQSASSDSSLMTRALGDARYFLNNAILTDFYDIPLANSNGANSGLNAFSIASNQGFTSTFTGGAAPAANSYAVWSNNYSGATQSSSSVFCGAGFGLTAIIQSPARDDCFTRLIVGGLSANTDRTLGTLTAKGFGIETDRSLAGTGNTAFRMRLLYNDGTTTHVGSWSLNQSSAKFRVWFINTGTQIIGYFVGIGTNVLPPKTFTALPFINTTVGDNFLTSSTLHQTFQVVTAGGTAANIYAEIQRVKQTYNFFPA